VRGIKSEDILNAQVEGDIEEVEGVLRITKIRLRYQMKIPQGKLEDAEKALAGYSKNCPAYQSIKGCIDCSLCSLRRVAPL
jgi:organic hydroperoxide reductase OsmC/OhrA